MPDRAFFTLTALIALAMIALALVWPQGMGAPGPSFGLAPPASDAGLRARQ
ncbi:MAG: hypothetical protein Q8L66_13635 [Caulobacter sp.]|nr:hypothetical protein [Caulobacter sp.]